MTGSAKSTDVELFEFLALDLPDDEQAIKIARQLAETLHRTIIVTDAEGKEIAVQPWKTLDS